MELEWNVGTLNKTVDRELDALPADMRARFVRISWLIASIGLERVGMPDVRRGRRGVWEMHMKGRDGGARALCVIFEAPNAAADQWVVVVRAFDMEKPGIRALSPRRELELALQRGSKIDELYERWWKMSRHDQLHEGWCRQPDYRAAYQQLGPEFDVIGTLLEALLRADFTPQEIASRMWKVQSAVARLESGQSRNSTED